MSLLFTFMNLSSQTGADRAVAVKLMEVVTLRERMTHAFWCCVPINFLIMRGGDLPVVLFLGIAIELVFVSYGYRLVAAIGGKLWQRVLTVCVLLLPFGNLLGLIFLRSWSMLFLSDHGVSKAKPWQMRNQIRRRGLDGRSPNGLG